MSNTPSQSRPPVVVVLGHVDHGKTALLDAVRKTNVAGKESGGITQHIGAYQIDVNGKRITFLDTPGHEAFTAIRSRGTKVADIAILVVAADESVKPQTKEAIKIILDEKIQAIVAINKIDKEGSNVQKVKQDLASENILVEDWGGQIPVIEVSAKKGTNIKELLDMILLVAEVEDLREDVSAPAQGVIIESNLDKRRGYVATALVQKGILGLGDWLVVGTVVGKVKSMEDSTGRMMTEAVPAQPVLITGWPSAPQIGQKFAVTENKDKAMRIAEDNIDLSPLMMFLNPKKEENEERKILNLVFKTDVSSSLEAIDNALSSIKSEQVGYRVLAYDIGNIAEGDIKTAISSKAQIIGFRVGIEESAKKLAEREGISIRSFDIIYDLVNHVRAAMTELLEPEIIKNVIGKIKVLAIFKKDARSQIVGGKVTSGKIIRGAMFDVIKNGAISMSGRISQLQHNKEESLEVAEGLEAGMKIESVPGKDFSQISEGDILEIYQEEKIRREL
ncbi:MAG: translation initiation factor IF-2 [Candidatus Yanofskybacteria bacterium RIFCSPHIGHO2_12_FULL_44_29b]|uniref:Translation initiation factor IF-2 n=1 Tax=Candidatus Yanofskybacteria bacterium GW2011_GWB1_45_11 TaxID=1619026 RepID=A0A0G1L2K2_9BACT|nr:MAG: Translation initiation factor IF-2 [Candidatus Yanofskybacteria bacterium GW2011_GWA2_44_10]KKT90028.1 MAG: Translation initiation factor IF-2 [Candidatus Yanofskybacteria bacterium GW2011_GWB1_45_11]OGN18346.1 MAG: translation initiation factor IF-2 [Candidatus Yanofskybacteria bacterium RIFCSPHIGHO2_12_FULL_44_29b]OGN26201.1 MAG: translation initiation factor IF-2 [Candidatus Yanofskybacteria bacterium RIFCSPLOWO2_01_FULL_44_88]